MQKRNILLLMSVMAGPLFVASSAGGGDLLPVLIKRSDRPEVYISNLLQGRLRIDEHGCLRFGEQDSLVIWHPDTRLSQAGDGRIQVIDGVTGRIVHVGEEMGTSGVLSETPVDAARLLEPMPEACASRSHIFAGPIMTEPELHGLRERWRHRKLEPIPQAQPQ